MTEEFVLRRKSREDLIYDVLDMEYNMALGSKEDGRIARMVRTCQHGFEIAEREGDAFTVTLIPDATTVVDRFGWNYRSKILYFDWFAPEYVEAFGDELKELREAVAALKVGESLQFNTLDGQPLFVRVEKVDTGFRLIRLGGKHGEEYQHTAESYEGIVEYYDLAGMPLEVV